jgi:hypothetical protein
MAYLIFTSLEEAQTYQQQVSDNLGYPEDPDSLIYVGGGIHAPKEEGLAVHYARIIKHQTEDQWALPQQDENTEPCISPFPVIGKGGKIERRPEIMSVVSIPEASNSVEELPEGWLPTEE